MVRYIILTIIIYLLVRFVFNFVIPLFRVTKQMRDQVKEFQDRMNEQQQYQRTSGPDTATGVHSTPKDSRRQKKPAGEYIDFEEIK